MDPYQDLLNTAREAAKALASKKVPDTYTGDDGTTVKGWVIESSPQPDSGDTFFSRAPGDFEDIWGDRKLVLTDDGKIYEFSEHYHQYGEARRGGARTDHTKRLEERVQSLLVGSRGKPFSEMKSKLERLPWTV